MFLDVVEDKNPKAFCGQIPLSLAEREGNVDIQQIINDAMVPEVIELWILTLSSKKLDIFKKQTFV